MKTGAGSAMQIHSVTTRFEGGVDGTKKGIAGDVCGTTKLFSSDIPKIRKMLRTDVSIQLIANEFGVVYLTMYNFIKRRQLCDMGERRVRIGYKKNSERGPIK